MSAVDELVFEDAPLESFDRLGCVRVFDPNFARGEPNSEDGSLEEMALDGRLYAAAEVKKTQDNLLPLLLLGRMLVGDVAE